MMQRPSGIEWVGEIPTDWTVLDLMWCCTERKVKNTGNQESNVLSLSYGRIVRRDVESNHGLLPESFETYQVVEPGNIILRLTDLQNDKRSLRTGLVPERGIITSAYVALETKQEFNTRFLHYLFHSYDVSKVFYGFGGGVRQSMKFEDLKHVPLVFPTLPTQKVIADFLDRKTAAIDALIEKKQKLLDLLAEKRAALINQAVTKGLDPNVSMKDSGIPWIGEIPAHWEVLRLKFVCTLETGHTPSRSEPSYWVEEECVIPWVSLNDTKTLKHTDYISETTYKISPLGMANSAAHLIPAGSVVFTRDATIGLTAILTEPMAVSQHIIGWVCGPEVDNEFLLQVLGCMTQELDRVTFGATLKTIGMADVKELTTPLPPLEVQRQIVAHLRTSLDRFDGVKERLLGQLQRLQEYRQALITAAVTGQLNICEEAA